MRRDPELVHKILEFAERQHQAARIAVPKEEFESYAPEEVMDGIRRCVEAGYIAGKTEYEENEFVTIGGLTEKGHDVLERKRQAGSAKGVLKATHPPSSRTTTTGSDHCCATSGETDSDGDADEANRPSAISHVLVADVLGFSRLVTNLDHRELDERLRNWVRLVEQVRVEVGIQDSRLISDTIFVRDDDSSEGLLRLLSYSKSLLERGLANHLPIRGAISRGRLTWGTLTYGKAVIRGHELERQQDWIGIACEPGMKDIPWSWDLVCCYPVPKKTGAIQRGPAVVWDIPASADLMQQCIGGGLMKARETFTWELHSKLANTLAFSEYVRNAKGHGANPEEYHGQHSPGPV